MFCGYNESFFFLSGQDYYRETCITNDTLLFCDHPIQCEAPFTADTDIGGLGVAYAFIATAWLTISFAVANAVRPTLETLGSFQHWKRERLLPPNRKTAYSPGPEFEQLERFSDLTLFSLCDLQLITGTSVLISGFAQWHTITFYHRVLAATYWNLTLTSFWAARSGGFRTLTPKTSQSPSKWDTIRTQFRTALVFITLTLATLCVILQVYGDEKYWDPCTSGKCYRSHDKSAYGSLYLWPAGTGIYAITSFIQLFPRGEQILANLNERIGTWLKRWGNSCWDQKDQISSTYFQFRITIALFDTIIVLTTVLRRAVWLFFSTVALFVVCCFFQFLSVWSSGYGFQAVEVAIYIGYAAWNTWDVSDLMSSNIPLLDGSESRRGFGQILPLCLMFLPLLGCFDAAQEVFE